ncbi:Holliday junction resolvase RuvX [Actinomycetaceae bacterium WB03_NA08]|uniref:Putative pre-16S rRNA nuclease n=1 Tax=Scrofimicrobium canadense TaxID=2652290 RepID=A0A6N7VQC9_9ACTO|nr:Holliday junction resolvase RuvX [Scrofimicrobium canadense]MSS83927.1 Holliday junction resolvase RuvX [Scrofimicrobium canadense]
MRQGTRLGIDVGTVRIGVARSDPLGTVAIPLETVRTDRRGSDIRRIVHLVDEYNAIEVVVGLPRHLNGSEGVSAHMARTFAHRLKKRVGETRVCLVDERLSSGQAHNLLADAGVDSRRSRSIVDQVAAQIILNQALDLERLSGELPGEPVCLCTRGEEIPSE